MHLRERREAALEEILQRAEAGEPRGLAHHPQRRAHQRLSHVAVERDADLADQPDLPLPAFEAPGAAISSAVIGDGERLRARPSASTTERSSSCDSALSSTATATVSMTLAGSSRIIAGTTPTRSASRCAKSAPPYRSFLEELDRRRIAWRLREVGVGIAQPPRLPPAEMQKRAREHRIGGALRMMLLHARELAQQCFQRFIVPGIGHRALAAGATVRESSRPRALPAARPL